METASQVVRHDLPENVGRERFRNKSDNLTKPYQTPPSLYGLTGVHDRVDASPLEA